MAKPHKSSASYTSVGAALLLFASLGLIVPFAQLLSDFVPPTSPFRPRLMLILAMSAGIIWAAAVVLKDQSVLWQVPLRSLAISALAVGIKYICTALFENPGWLLTPGAGVSLGYLTLGIGAGALLRHLQKRILGRRGAT